MRDCELSTMLRNSSTISLRSGLFSTAVVALLSFAPLANPESVMAPAKASQQTAAEPSSCKGILSRPDKLMASLLAVPKYQKTYVLLLAGNAKNKITSPTSPDLADIPIEIDDEPQAIAVTESLHLTNVRRVPVTGQSLAQPLVDLAAAKTEAAIMWGPLAGAGLIDLGLEDKVAVFSVDRPRDPPTEFGEHAAVPADACASAIADDLDSFGVLPAELLVPVSIRSILGSPAPIFSMEDALRGEQAFEQNCARCHGSHAVADPTLAPVDLLRSIRRFQFVGFKYIVMNGRQQKGMPPLRGTISEDQIASVYQYLRARSKKLLPAGPSNENK
jgi:cytochrome c553